MLPEAMLPARPTFRDSAVFRLLLLGLLVLLLLIPLAMVRSLIGERQGRMASVQREIARLWGGPQRLGGPVLTVPYETSWTDDQGVAHRCLATATFLPETLSIQARLEPELRRRGLFESVVYRARLSVAGSFQPPTFAGGEATPERIDWQQARLSIGIPDLRGLPAAIDLDWNGRTVPFSPGSAETRLWSSGLQAEVPGLAEAPRDRPLTFAFELTLAGSDGFTFLPLGKETTVEVASSWPSPSFEGAFLPDSREVGPTGFRGRWRISFFARSYPQSWHSREAEQVAAAARVEDSAFGVTLFLPADLYQKSERSAKYGVLFLVLTFATFFLFEVLSPLAIHPVHYLLVGTGLCLFYLLLLSLAEHLGFGGAYLAAAAATAGLIGAYSAAILGARRRAAAIAVVLAALYGYLYVLLQAEDYALLLGSLGLFALLATAMYLTRRVDWGRRATVATP